MAAFSEAQRAVLARGFPDNLTTYALVSSIWTSTFALGAFVGPTAAGSLYDLVGFRWSMLFPVGWNVVVGLAAAAIMLSRSGGIGGNISLSLTKNIWQVAAWRAAVSPQERLPGDR